MNISTCGVCLPPCVRADYVTKRSNWIRFLGVGFKEEICTRVKATLLYLSDFQLEDYLFQIWLSIALKRDFF